MDLSILVPTLTRFGAPMLAELFETAATAAGGPLAGMAVTGISNFVLSKLGAAFNVPSDDPAAISQAVETAAQADPVATQAKLQEVQDDHSDLIKQAMAQAALDEQNVENARATSVSLAQIGTRSTTLLAAAPAILGVFNLGMFAWVAWFLFSGHNVDSPNGNLIVGTIIGAFATTQAYFGGSSAIAKHRGDQAIDFAHQTLPPAKRAAR